jgi:rare lipoprotein A
VAYFRGRLRAAQRSGDKNLKKIVKRAPILAPLIFVAACNTTASVADVPSAGAQILQRGKASWYGPGFHGRRTASGENFNSSDMTAAHRSLPFGTKVRVVNESSGRSVVVRINDRGPYAHGRIIDLARGPAQALGLMSTGTAVVALQSVDQD